MKTIFSKPILNIFSNKNIEPEEKPRIIMDYREKNSLIYAELLKLNLDVEIKELKVGDYLVNGVIIERKTIGDFISSMLSKRLSHQIEDLKQTENKLIIIEGYLEKDLYPEGEGLHPNSIRGFLISILLKHKIPVLFTKNTRDSANFLNVIARRKEKESSFNISKKTKDHKEKLRFILEGFPGIGPKTSKKLLEKFQTIKNIINADEEEMKKILGKKYEIFKKLIEEP